VCILVLQLGYFGALLQGVAANALVRVVVVLCKALILAYCGARVVLALGRLARFKLATRRDGDGGQSLPLADTERNGGPSGAASQLGLPLLRTGAPTSSDHDSM
jgi:hypothetical protein